MTRNRRQTLPASADETTRKYYTAGTLEASRVIELEKLGMVWSVHASVWDAGLEVARSYAAVHGHCLPGASVVWDSFPLGTWMKNQRAAARKAAENAARAGKNGCLVCRAAL
ncbi:hypothetical protein QFZ75_008089 [Streptomyces sp. V3I8]|uniref:helicase associated domain-containing protein n=1 Tax=Streptomyces sp. V3I8 TaxID=3042279 RepID=UPI002787EFEB|nr:helicase associated domain-containing protein [Streptomyces sp. V3I8]MDQ1041587.1 hypothetical protein [Streptomyces sp. V3I8]